MIERSSIPKRSLITTFDTWLPHQKSNASDDLILALEAEQALPEGCRVLHRLPVDVDLAFEQIQRAIVQHRPAYLFCCGMAEGRSKLNFELQAVDSSSLETHTETYSLKPPAPEEQSLRRTLVSKSYWESMRTQWRCAEVSEDAGRFVCNGLYYRLLDPTLGETLGQPLVLFIHVPLLTADNRRDLMTDFLLMLSSILAFEQSGC